MIPTHQAYLIALVWKSNHQAKTNLNHLDSPGKAEDSSDLVFVPVEALFEVVASHPVYLSPMSSMSLGSLIIPPLPVFVLAACYDLI